MNYDELVTEIQSHGGFAERTEAERALLATVAVLADQLDESMRRAMTEELPSPLAQKLRRVRRPPIPPATHPEEFYRRVARRERVRIGRAIEHAQVVCQVLGENLSDARRTRLRHYLPSEVADLFVPRPPFPPPPEHPLPTSWIQSPEGNTLATGRPYSHHPISESRPERAHTHSVARSDDPHAATRLSSSRGLTQERLGETLATGRPGSRRPISGG